MIPCTASCFLPSQTTTGCHLTHRQRPCSVSYWSSTSSSIHRLADSPLLPPAWRRPPPLLSPFLSLHLNQSSGVPRQSSARSASSPDSYPINRPTTPPIAPLPVNPRSHPKVLLRTSPSNSSPSQLLLIHPRIARRNGCWSLRCYYTLSFCVGCAFLAPVFFRDCAELCFRLPMADGLYLLFLTVAFLGICAGDFLVP